MRETRTGVRPTGAGQPLKTAFGEAIKATEVRLHLQPLQGAFKRKLETAPESKPKGNAQDEELAKLRRTVANLQGQLRNSGRDSSKGGGRQRSAQRSDSKGKSWGKRRRWLTRMPPSLIGMSPTTENGEPICYNFNLDGCDGAEPGGRCDKGWHVCMKPGCGQAHSLKNHR